MKKHIVTCVKCGRQFDVNEGGAYYPESRRYVCKRCVDKQKSEQSDREKARKAEERKAKDMLQKLFEYYYQHPQELPEDFQPQLSFEGLERTVCDYIAGMTDNYAVGKFHEIFVPVGWNVHG